jgi:hypothetical protein
MNNFELIDEYLTNRLSESDKQNFESQLETDPALKSEVALQKQVLTGIKKARIAELKTMLNNIPVETTPVIQISPLRIAAGIAGAAMIAASVYLYLNKGAEFKLDDISSSVSDSINKPEVKESASPLSESDSSKAIISTETESENKKGNSNKNRQSTNTQIQTRPSIDVLDPSNEANESIAKVNPSVQELPVISAKSQIEVQFDNTNSNYKFHYQFKQGKLRLYGDFNSELFEIIDINTEQHTMFLFYQNNYYFLDETKTEVSPLLEIKDETLLKKLKQYRDN